VVALEAEHVLGLDNYYFYIRGFMKSFDGLVWPIRPADPSWLSIERIQSEVGSIFLFPSCQHSLGSRPVIRTILSRWRSSGRSTWA
jgi:hypothetical protein